MQLSFSFNDAEDIVQGPRAEAAATHKANISTGPHDLSRCDINRMSLEEFLKSMGCDGVISRFYSYRVYGNRLVRVRDGRGTYMPVETEYNGKGMGKTLAYVDGEMGVWTCTLSITINDSIMDYVDDKYIKNFSVSKWARMKNVKLVPGLAFIQPQEELERILKDRKPYADEWRKNRNADVRCCILAPYLEILDKAGYRFVHQFLKYKGLGTAETEALGRLCQNGTKPKDIFKTGKVIYTTLKNDIRMSLWDCYRKMFKFNRINADTIRQVYDLQMDEKALEYISAILGVKYEDRLVFTWQTLMQYLVRLDTFEAVSMKEALPLLNDYLHMCNQLNMKPRTDGDSLKREHDIAARNVRNRRDEIMAEKMRTNCERMKIYDYSENIYMVRGVRDYNDLLDEANQQHNCVASYGSRIAAGKSLIYVMREVSCPDKSLITIELSPDGKTIRQKFLAYNQPIRNKSQSEFIERWMKHIRSVA